MARFILFLILLVPLVAAGHWLLAHPGHVAIAWLGYEIHLNMAVAAVILGVGCLLLVLTVLIIWQFITWPERARARRKYRTMARGLKQLTHAVTALALHDERTAQRALKKASEALPGEPLPQLLHAQLLQRKGDHAAARKELRALMKHESTAQLASHRLIEQHLEDKEWGQALALAEQLRSEEPNDRWLTLTLIDLYGRRHEPHKMLELTEGWKFKSPLSREERHRYAAIAYSLIAQEKEDARSKLTALRHATGYAPDFLPATIAYAEALTGDGDLRPARKLLRQSWLKQPDALLIAPIVATLKGESPRAATRMLQAFLHDAERPLQYRLEAEHALSLDRPGEARAAVEKALALEESKALYTLLAEVERRLRGEEAANRVLTRAVDAPADASWVCQRCGTHHDTWQLHCGGCEAFDTLRHEKPETRITSVE